MSRPNRWRPTAPKPWDFFQLLGFVIGQLALMPVDELRWWIERRAAKKELRDRRGSS